MSIINTSRNDNLNIPEKESKENNKHSDEPNKNNNFSNSNISNNSKTINNSSMIYSYPICLQNERDPLDEYKLKIIKAKNKGSDTFLKNYLKFNFSKNSINNNSNINTNKNLNDNIFENNKNNLFITENKKFYKQIQNPINYRNKSISTSSQKKIISKSNSEIFNPYSPKAINHYKTLYLMEMEKRGHQYNKIRMASLQRIALHNFSHMNLYDNHFVNGSIPSGKSNESYILETKKRRKLPSIREYICYRLKNMRDNNESNTPEYYLEKFKKYEKNKLPEIIDIKNSGRFKFHVYHDQYGFKKELDKREMRRLKMTKDKIRDLKIMSIINKTNEPELIDIFKRATYED